MAPGPYVYERQTEYWTSNQIETFFGDLGFEVLAFPITQLTEKKLPADYLFFDSSLTKLFGFQYKPLYHNGQDYWPITKSQHERLRHYPWVYYCLCEMRDVRDRRAALHLSRIVRTDFPFVGKLGLRRATSDPLYMRWGAFYQGLVSCRYGIKVTSEKELLANLSPENHDGGLYELRELLVELILVEIEKRRVLRFSPFIADHQGRG